VKAISGGKGAAGLFDDGRGRRGDAATNDQAVRAGPPLRGGDRRLKMEVEWLKEMRRAQRDSWFESNPYRIGRCLARGRRAMGRSLAT
jgi:hypothetical protein